LISRTKCLLSDGTVFRPNGNKRFSPANRRNQPGIQTQPKKSRPNPKGTDGQTHYGENVLLNESAKQTLLKQLQL
ncbi:TPA: hypothetical protein ACFNVB_000821, partial [Neisseria meningitidis]